MAEAPTVYTLPPQPAYLGPAGIFYLVLVSVWTALVIGAMGFLIYHRNDPIVRTRGLYLTLGAVCCLHPYWALGHMVVPVFPMVQISVMFNMQYFFMGLWLPIGIGLFQASNLRFLYVAKQQRQYAQTGKLEVRVSKYDQKASLWQRFRAIDYAKRVYFFVGIAIIVQIVITVSIWAACRKYHPTFGTVGGPVPSDVPIPQQVWLLNNGWEWWPTCFWQFFWTWIVAPILLIQTWHIDDTLGWRTQTFWCCITGLPGTPLFIIASYAEAFKPINAWYTPSNWIMECVEIWVIIFLFVPCYQIIKASKLRKHALESNAKSKEFDAGSMLTTSTLTPSPRRSTFAGSMAEEGLAKMDMSEIDEDKLLTLSALDHVLRKNPEPLQDFSALRDFSGENVAFLVRAAEWKSETFEVNLKLSEDIERLRAFTKALEIYALFISPRDAAFPLNISGRQLQPLLDVFGEAAKSVYGDTRHDSAVPSEFEGPTSTTSLAEKRTSQFEVHAMTNGIKFDGTVPAAFNMEIFDDVIAHVRQLVFLNTWPKFVRDLRSRRMSGESQRTENSWASQETLVDKTVLYFKGMLMEKKWGH